MLLGQRKYSRSKMHWIFVLLFLGLLKQCPLYMALKTDSFNEGDEVLAEAIPMISSVKRQYIANEQQRQQESSSAAFTGSTSRPTGTETISEPATRRSTNSDAANILGDVNKYGLWEYTSDNTGMGEQIKSLMNKASSMDVNAELSSHALQSQAKKMNDRINKYAEDTSDPGGPAIDPMETPPEIEHSRFHKPLSMYKQIANEGKDSGGDQYSVVTIPSTMTIEDEQGKRLDTVSMDTSSPTAAKDSNEFFHPTHPLMTARLLKAMQGSAEFRKHAEELLPMKNDSDIDLFQKERQLSKYLKQYENSVLAEAESGTTKPDIKLKIPTTAEKDSESVGTKNEVISAFRKLIHEDSASHDEEGKLLHDLMGAMKTAESNEGKIEAEFQDSNGRGGGEGESLSDTYINHFKEFIEKQKQANLIHDDLDASEEDDHPLGSEGSPLRGYLEKEASSFNKFHSGSNPKEDLEALEEVLTKYQNKHLSVEDHNEELLKDQLKKLMEERKESEQHLNRISEHNGDSKDKLGKVGSSAPSSSSSSEKDSFDNAIMDYIKHSKHFQKLLFSQADEPKSPTTKQTEEPTISDNRLGQDSESKSKQKDTEESEKTEHKGKVKEIEESTKTENKAKPKNTEEITKTGEKGKSKGPAEFTKTAEKGKSKETDEFTKNESKKEENSDASAKEAATTSEERENKDDDKDMKDIPLSVQMQEIELQRQILDLKEKKLKNRDKDRQEQKAKKIKMVKERIDHLFQLAHPQKSGDDFAKESKDTADDKKVKEMTKDSSKDESKEVNMSDVTKGTSATFVSKEHSATDTNKGMKELSRKNATDSGSKKEEIINKNDKYQLTSGLRVHIDSSSHNPTHRLVKFAGDVNKEDPDAKLGLPINNPKPEAEETLQPNAFYHYSQPPTHLIHYSVSDHKVTGSSRSIMTPILLKPHFFVPFSNSSAVPSSTVVRHLAPSSVKNATKSKKKFSTSSFKSRHLSPPSLINMTSYPVRFVASHRGPSLMNLTEDNSAHNVKTQSSLRTHKEFPIIEPPPLSTDTTSRLISKVAYPELRGRIPQIRFIRPRSNSTLKDVIATKKSFGKLPVKPKEVLLQELKADLKLLASSKRYLINNKIKTNMTTVEIDHYQNKSKQLGNSELNRTIKNQTSTSGDRNNVIIPYKRNNTVEIDVKSQGRTHVIVPQTVSYNAKLTTRSFIKSKDNVDNHIQSNDSVHKDVQSKDTITNYVQSKDTIGSKTTNIEDVFNILQSEDQSR